MKMVVVLLGLFALAAEAAPGPHKPAGPTEPFVVEGVEMPPRYTEDEWSKRNETVKMFWEELEKVDDAIEERWLASLTPEQKAALDTQKRKRKERDEENKAKARRREWEIEHIVERVKWVNSEVKTKRRIERTFSPGLKWMDSDLVKETITIGESGKVKIHILYTADGKRHRFDPESVEREIAKKHSAQLLDSVTTKED